MDMDASFRGRNVAALGHRFMCALWRLAVVKIIMGIVFIAGGLSGKLVLIGTQSGAALAVLGAGLIVWGIFQLKSNNA